MIKCKIDAGVGLGVDVHAIVSKTETKKKINIFDMANSVWNTVRSWLGGK